MVNDRTAVVWVADDQVAPGLDYGFRLAERLRSRHYRVARRDLTSDLDTAPAAALHVLSGGGTSVYASSGWMPDALELTRQLVADARQGHHSVLGVCLGSQMIAASQWQGAVGEGDRIEVGLTEVGWRLGTTGQQQMVVPDFHYEVVDPGAVRAGDGEIVADNGRAGLEGFRLGSRVLGVQFHPELTPDDLPALVAYHRSTIESHGVSPGDVLEEVAAMRPRWTSHAFAEVLRLLAD